MRAIAEAIAAERGFALADLRGASRRRPLVHARQEAMTACYATGRYSTAQVGRFFNRDHSTVVHARWAHAARQALGAAE